MKLSLRLSLLAIACSSLAGCSDDDGTVDTPLGGANAGGDTSGGMTGAGTAGTPSSAGSISTGGNGGVATGGASNGGLAGVGGMIDANGGAPAGPADGRHTARASGTMPGTTAGYWEYLPPHYGNGALYPLLVFRHGIGENGTGSLEDLKKVLSHGPPKLIEANQWPEDRAFVVLSVQHPGDGCSSPQENEDFLEFAMENYDVDPKRVYITGLSCGAIGSWDYLGAHTDERVAAAVLICGNGRPAFQKAGCKLGNVPIWAFHGEDDETVVPEGSTETVGSLKACSNPAPVDVKLVTYPGVGHDSWTMTYNLSNPENDIYAWMMSHSKK